MLRESEKKSEFLGGPWEGVRLKGVPGEGGVWETTQILDPPRKSRHTSHNTTHKQHTTQPQPQYSTIQNNTTHNGRQVGVGGERGQSGSTSIWPNSMWPNSVLAKLGQAKVGQHEGLAKVGLANVG